MKTNPSHQPGNRGSVLLVTMSILAVGLIALAGYLMVVQAENNNVARSQAWNSIISVSEAGVEEGLALVNQGYPSVIQNSWAWTNSATGWTSPTNGVFTLSRTVYSSNSYAVTVDIRSGTPTITSVGTVAYTPIPWAFSANRGPMFAAAGMPFLAAGTTGGNSTNSTTTTTSSTLGRKVQIQTVLSTLFSAAMVAKQGITFKGNNCVVDSFDSSNPLYSTGGLYDVTKRKANGSVGTDSSIVSEISVQNANIYGKAMTGPGTVQSAVSVGSQGAVGDASWNASHTGVETGFWSGDFNVNIPDVPAPAASASLPAASNGVIYLTAGAYLATSDPGKQININGSVILWVTTSYSPNIVFNTNNPNANLALYVGATSGSSVSLSLGGNGTLNYPGYARNLQIYGLPSCTGISFNGNAGFTGTIYAPEATVSGGGGGNNTQDTSGAIIANAISANGHWNYHYDESLGTNGPSRGWIPKNWTELKYP
jgi:hypothetical protein